MIIDYFFQKSNKPSKVSATSEATARSVVKSISWRIIGTLDTVVISYIVTGELTLAFSIGSIELLTKMLLYFFHERFWNQITWGKQDKKLK
ncbi:MAG: DUF2061 domain-containing protein [Flavobacteriaceae bacterium]